MTPKIFAELVLLAQQIRANSYTTASFLKSYENAAREACAQLGVDDVWITPVEILNWGGRADIKVWAEDLQPELPAR